VARKKPTFAVFLGNRGFFPAHLMSAARKELSEVLERLGYGCLMMPADATRHGAVETPAEGRLYAEWLRENRGRFDGVILSLPNFGDETGAVSALKEARVPILIQAYPDELDKMSPALRRDSFCGKLSIMDVFHQYGVPFTALPPHTVSPSSERFAQQLDYFARLCAVVNGVRGMVVGAIGARTTAFKTVRIDELALQRAGITMETYDLSDVFKRMEGVGKGEEAYVSTAERLKAYSDCSGLPAEAFDKLVRLSVVLHGMVEEFGLDAIALRCWVEMQQQLGISPCLILSEMNDRGIPAACEVDVGNAVCMFALSRASGNAPACLDWNNNYGEEEDKCILFHCGSAPRSLMTGTGRVVDHAILANAAGPGCGWGCYVGRLAPGPITFASMTTEAGRLKFYLGEGRFTEDPIPEDFFGCAGVAEIPGLQRVLLHVGLEGHRHHTSITRGHVMGPVREALERYLGCEVAAPQES